MSEIIDPPEYYFTGINFNPAFYNQDAGTGLSQSTANNLYLRKTVPDTATALETFNSGIITPSITSTGPLNIVVPVASATDILNVAVGSRTISGQIHHYSDGDNCVVGAGVHLNNGLNNNSATNIHNGTGANPSGTVNIMTGTSNSGTVTIGSTSTTTNIKGNSTIGVVGSGTVTINRPITVEYDPASLAVNQIGYTIDETLTGSGTVTSASEFNMFTSNVTLSKGVWLICYSFNLTSAGTSTITQYGVYGRDSVNLTNPVQAYNLTTETQVVTATGLCSTGSFVVVSSGTTTYNVSCYILYSGSNLSFYKTGAYRSVVKRTRIA